MKEYAIKFTSNDGTETHIVGHYPDRKRAEESAERHRRYGNRDVKIMVRVVSEWEED